MVNVCICCLICPIEWDLWAALWVEFLLKKWHKGYPLAIFIQWIVNIFMIPRRFRPVNDSMSQCMQYLTHSVKVSKWRSCMGFESWGDIHFSPTEYKGCVCSQFLVSGKGNEIAEWGESFGDLDDQLNWQTVKVGKINSSESSVTMRRLYPLLWYWYR